MGRKESERTLRTLCACAEILLKKTKFADATRKWKIGHEPVRLALKEVNRNTISDIDRALPCIRKALDSSYITLRSAACKSNENKGLRSLPYNRRKPIQKTIFK